MRYLTGIFKILLRIFIILAAIAGLAYAYDNFGRSYNKYVVIDDDDMD